MKLFWQGSHFNIILIQITTYFKIFLLLTISVISLKLKFNNFIKMLFTMNWFILATKWVTVIIVISTPGLCRSDFEGISIDKTDQTQACYRIFIWMLWRERRPTLKAYSKPQCIVILWVCSLHQRSNIHCTYLICYHTQNLQFMSYPWDGYYDSVS